MLYFSAPDASHKNLYTTEHVECSYREKVMGKSAEAAKRRDFVYTTILLVCLLVDLIKLAMV